MNKLFHHIHLWISLPLGLVITVICLTGAALVFEREITRGMNPHLYRVTEQGNIPPLSPSEIVARIGEQLPDSLHLTSLQLSGNPRETWMAAFKETGKRSLSLNPYTGEVNGWTQTHPFFQTLRKLHRWLLDPPAFKGGASAGKTVVGITTLLMVFILVSGLVIWIPRNRRALKNRLRVACNKGWRRFWYDSHVSLGFYATLFLLVMALTGLTWSFPWYRNAAYSLLGASPSRSQAPKSPSHSSPKEERAAAFDYAVWDKVMRELHQQYPSYASITLSRSEAKISLPGRMRRSDTVRFDSRTGEIRKVIPYQDTPRAQQLKMWFYAFHTGTWGGLTTQILYFLAALIGGILPLSGYYLWFKRARRRKTTV